MGGNKIKNVLIISEEKLSPLCIKVYVGNTLPIHCLMMMKHLFGRAQRICALQQCKKKCCSITAIPLMICKSLSIHKSQGMTVGHGKQLTKVVVHLPVGVGENKCLRLELVAVSRAVELNDFAVGNSITELTKQALLRIGNTDAYRARNMFLEETRRKPIPSQEQTIVAITQLDTCLMPLINVPYKHSFGTPDQVQTLDV